jgi:hypothetical protein
MCSGIEGAESPVRFRRAIRGHTLKLLANLRRVRSCLVRLQILVAAGGMMLLSSGCNRENEQIKVYRLAKAPLEFPPAETNPAASASDSASEAPSAEVPPPGVPPNWQPQSLSQMRKASFLAHGENGAIADISLVILGTAAGNVLDNVNRWRSQLGQPPLSTEQLAGSVQHLSTPRGEVSVADISGTPENGDSSKDGRIVAGMILDDGKTSFFKMRGNSALVGAEKENFLKWVSAVCGAGSAGETANSAPASNPAAPKIKWDVPPAWKTGQPSAMRYASFTAADEADQKADISVVTFPGDGGNDIDNVNRWRQQIGLPALEPGLSRSAVLPMKIADNTFSTIDLNGAKSRVVTAWVRRDGRTWFFKLTGPKETVEREKPIFVKFLQSVRF